MTYYDPKEEMLAGYTPIDGTVEFYSRINALLRPDQRVLDLGAGRGSWYFEEKSAHKRALMTIKGKVREYLACDVDPAVLNNPTTDRNLLMENGRIPVEDGTIDVIVSDFVVEHVLDVEAFRAEVARVLKPGGYFCARTPHRLNYVSFAARMVKNSRHNRWLRFVQPRRKAEDTFPTAYRCNSRVAVRRVFSGWQDYTYVYTAEPAYYFGSKGVYRFMSVMHRLLPSALTGCLFIFLRKPAGP